MWISAPKRTIISRINKCGALPPNQLRLKLQITRLHRAAMYSDKCDPPTVGRYPGLGMNLRYHNYHHEGEMYPTGIHYNSRGAESDMLLVREAAMMIVMNQLTDKPDWHIKVFDDAIAEKWVQEALALPVDPLYDEIVQHRNPGFSSGAAYGPDRLKYILDRGCLKYCIKELRVKAKFFEKTGLIPALDANATVIKSDTFIDETLHKRLRNAFAKLKEGQKDNPDWHPRSNDMVQNLVHPSLYPLVYGRSRVFRDEVVGVEDAIDKWSGKGEVIPKKPVDIPSEYDDRYHINYSVQGSDAHKMFWSDAYQWLPSNVKLMDDGSVKLTSYINNLHPKHRDIYEMVEELIERALPAWDHCVAFCRDWDIVSGGRTKSRFPRPENPDDENEANWSPSIDDFTPHDAGEVEYEEVIRDADGDLLYDTRKRDAWEKIREPVQPEAPEFKAWDYGVKPGTSLRERFKDLQVIVKMASIELTPDKPKFPAGGWHVEGQMNEHIVGTALYYLDSENVKPSYLQFRMQTDYYQEDWNIGQDAFGWMEQVYGTNLRGGDCLQRYGKIETKQGRLLAFPNVFHHRVSPVELDDMSKPGHRRFIALWLIDPRTRIINTGNVPPQQKSWWTESAFRNLGEENASNVPNAVAKLVSEGEPEHPGLKAAAESGKPLPQELVNMVEAEADNSILPMSLEEAKEHRLKLMDERTSYQRDAEQSWSGIQYSFCEH
ncbi:uncharacterized protein BKA55DRAFT_577383 [Fusarium redolens]|uniref:Uncharacterized protein n=1 Tax=Fusarium redolens TaxID=48865 RepID=A0A9P9K133_FUSRE|nr:uncharacterized protein BKA55DRAFT_577383 [Fusarium redolens]KAH7240356.1 hypothetical protein BKA55DRAFT_577383 [Fusarium redolens]